MCILCFNPPMDSNSIENSPKTVSFHTLGCKLNFSETGHIAQGFKERNYSIVPWGEQANVTFINTCTVTDSADSSCRNIIRAAKRFSPQGTIVVAGCMSQISPQKIAEIPGVDLVLGTHEKHRVFEYLEEDLEEGPKIHINKSNEFWGAKSGMEGDSKTRAFLKIQDGCNYVCSFCIIPFARGRSRCISLDLAKEQISELIKANKKEIVITGVNIGEFHGEKGEDLADFIQQVWDPTSKVLLRMSSMEPNTITEKLLKVLKDIPTFQDHFHIPLQAGSDKVLSLMKRKYTVQRYKEAILLIRKYFPNSGVGGDIIVGHPGEEEEDFQQTLELVKELNLTHLHVFPYSRRKGTVSDKMVEQVPAQVKKKRSSILRTLGDQLKLQWIEQQIKENPFQNVLLESENEGYTSNYIKVRYVKDEGKVNEIVKLRLFKGEGLEVMGSPFFVQ